MHRADCLVSLFRSQHNPSEEIDFRPKHPTKRKRKLHVAALISQDFKQDGRRSRPYQTLLPLSKALNLPIHHHCDREDAECVNDLVEKYVSRGENVLISWQHTALTKIAKRLGVKGMGKSNHLRGKANNPHFS